MRRRTFITVTSGAAVAHGALGDTRAVHRSLGAAGDALARADGDIARPPWMVFYDRAEYEGLSMLAYMRLGHWDQAEAHAHRAITARRPEMERNHALTLADLARAQLEQGDAAAAVATAAAIGPSLWRGRAGQLLDRFGARLTVLAKDSPETRAWADHTRTNRASQAGHDREGGRA